MLSNQQQRLAHSAQQAVLIVLFAIAVFVWGVLDGQADARANPDPDRRDDLAMTWLLAGLFAGIVSGAVTWLISLFYKSLYVEALVNEVTTFAAFTALLVFLASVAGVSLGRWLVDRNLEKQPRQHHGLAEAAADAGDPVILNAGALTHTSVALRDACAELRAPLIEVHISNVHNREEFRHHSYISGVATGVIVGLGVQGYVLALRYLASLG